LSDCGTSCNRLRHPRCHWMCRRRVPAVSGRVLSRVHWVRPEVVVEVKYLSWTDDNLLRQVIYQGLREDKPPSEVRRPVPHPKSAAPESRPVHSKGRQSSSRK
jgi:ATP-dependent DNA ligase